MPTEALQLQWKGILDSLGLGLNCDVQIINSVVTKNWNCDLLVLDECHRYNSDMFKQVFEKTKRILVLGLTATFERLDGKHIIMQKCCPVIDTINIGDALANGWVSSFTEYEVLIEVDDINNYREVNAEFNKHFEFFQYNFALAMSMCGENGYKARIKYRDFLYQGKDERKKSEVLKSIMYHSKAFNTALQARKAFINNHPKKLEIARKIIEARQDKKIITFANSITMADKLRNTSLNIDNEYTYSGKDSKKKGRVKIESFNEMKTGVLHTIRKADEGLDCKGLSVGIIYGTDSSTTKATQRLGRVIRKEEGKSAEVFNIIILDTVESKWFENSHKNSPVIRIDEEGLNKVLKYENPEPYKRKILDFTFRY